jgi:aminoglycoside 3-N-acetyltransferase
MGALESGSIKSILQSMSLPRDAVLIVHSAIRGLSQQGFKAQAIIESLLESIPDGTLLMPTMTWKTVTLENPIFDEMLTPSHTGVLTEIFRTQYATARSLHPTHSVAGLGPQAAKLLATHHIGTTPAPLTSPYGIMQEHESYILLLGVGLEMCTAFHHAEEVTHPDVYVKPLDESEAYQLVSRGGTIINYQLRRHQRIMRDFEKFRPTLLEKDMTQGNIGGVPWSIVGVNNLLMTAKNELKVNKFATLML